MYTVGERVTVVLMKIEKNNRQDIPKCLSCDPVTKRFCVGVLGENNCSNPAMRINKASFQMYRCLAVTTSSEYPLTILVSR